MVNWVWHKSELEPGCYFHDKDGKVDYAIQRINNGNLVYWDCYKRNGEKLVHFLRADLFRLAKEACERHENG